MQTLIFSNPQCSFFQWPGRHAPPRTQWTGIQCAHSSHHRQWAVLKLGFWIPCIAASGRNGPSQTLRFAWGAYTHTNTNTVLPMVIRMRMILSETRTTSYTFSHHSSARRTPTPPVPLSFPDQKSLKRESFPTICLTPSIFHLVSWRQHRSTLLLDTVSTTSLAFCFIVPTLSVPTRKDFKYRHLNEKRYLF